MRARLSGRAGGRPIRIPGACECRASMSQRHTAAARGGFYRESESDVTADRRSRVNLAGSPEKRGQSPFLGNGDSSPARHEASVAFGGRVRCGARPSRAPVFPPSGLALLGTRPPHSRWWGEPRYICDEWLLSSPYVRGVAGRRAPTRTGARFFSARTLWDTDRDRTPSRSPGDHQPVLECLSR